MTTVQFSITPDVLSGLLTRYTNTEKNSDVGNLAVAIAELYFLSLCENTTFIRNRNGVDLLVITPEGQTEYEVKGTVDTGIAWQKLKVSSTACMNKLMAGMPLIRVCGIGRLTMTIYFLLFGEDFLLQEEARWAVKPITSLTGKPRKRRKGGE